MAQAAKAEGVDARADKNPGRNLKEQGFVSIAERVYTGPPDEWLEARKAKDIGKATTKATKTNLMKGLEGSSMLLLTKVIR